ncbi:MAG: efflux RND transporter periplasmic adaptor subunit [Desulfosudaceae bacterium]
MKKKTIWIAALIIGASAAAGIVFFPGADSEKTSENAVAEKSGNSKPAPLVQVLTAKRNDITKALELSGSVEPYRIARLASPAEGPVTDIRVREADRVTAGQPLLSIGRKKGVDTQIVSLREELKKEEKNLHRIRKLIANQALPEEQLDQARAAYENVRALLIKAEETARDHSIQAPWAGVVSRVEVKEGEFVAPRAVLLEMYDPDSLVIRTAIPEKHAAGVAVGMPVEVRLDAHPESIFPGRVERVYPYLDSRLRTRTVEITLDQSVSLLPGMFARLSLSLQSADKVVVVPLEALVRTPTGPVVFVVEEGRALARPVQTGIEADNRVEIISGIQAGDKIIVAGNEKLKTGTAVRVTEATKPDKKKGENMAEPTGGSQSGRNGDDR